MSSANSRKEPSMDEILASIRRIIESGDEGEAGSTVLSIPSEVEDSPRSRAGEPVQAADPADPAALASPVPPFDIHYHPTSLGDDTLVGRHVMPSAPVDDEPTRIEGGGVAIEEGEVVSLADQADNADSSSAAPAAAADVSDDAWWDAAVADANDVAADVAPAAADRPNALGYPMPVNENDAGDERPEEPRFEDPVPAADVSAEPSIADSHPETTSSSTAGEVVSQNVPVPFALPEKPTTQVSAGLPEQAARPAIPESVLAGASALLSAQAGDQVAAAFEDLTRAIREGQMRSMEGMAREIMRPMLQDWLDDNLPRIVERLVREEIERIARGPRR